MSTVKATNIQNASSSSVNAITTSGGDLTNAAGVSFMGGSKNLLINGAMAVSQRQTSVASITTSAYYTADRWYTFIDALGTWTQSIENDAPSGSGMRKSTKLLCSVADAAPSAGDYFIFRQYLEGQDLQRIAKGTSSAQQLTLSFWVKSNVTGTYVASLYDVDNSRNVAASYTISQGATWERKVLTFPADTTGAFDNDNQNSFAVSFWLGAGSTYTSGSLATAWQSYSAANAAVGQTNLAAATNNYWQVTGVQLEVGPVASSFEFESFEATLRKCQRYYETSYNYGVYPGTSNPVGLVSGFLTTVGNGYVYGSFRFGVPKRAVPTSVTTYAYDGTINRISNGDATTAAANTGITTWVNGLTPYGFSLQNTSGGAFAPTGSSYYFAWVANAEL